MVVLHTEKARIQERADLKDLMILQTNTDLSAEHFVAVAEAEVEAA